MEPNTVYTATLTLSSGAGIDGNTHIEYTWNPPLLTVLEEFGEDNLPSAYLFMGKLLEQGVFPAIAFNERYEALLLEDPEAEEILNENPTS